MSDASNKTKLLTAIEACRPGSDDVALPEMSQLADAMSSDPEIVDRYERTQSSDAALAAAFREVELPTGLEDRLRAALESQGEIASEDQAKSDHDTPSSSKSLAPQQPSRRWMLAGGLAACALMAAGIGLTLTDWSSPAGREELASAAVDLHQQLTPDDWRFDTPAPTDRPAFDRLQRDVIAGGWAPVDVAGDSRGIAYRFTHRRGATATLFVFRPGAIDPNLPLAPPLDPARPTSRVTAGVWTNGTLVYALVVDGGIQQYQSFIRSNSVAIVTAPAPPLS
jgi:hypothetical protein